VLLHLLKKEILIDGVSLAFEKCVEQICSVALEEIIELSTNLTF